MAWIVDETWIIDKTSVCIGIVTNLRVENNPISLFSYYSAGHHLDSVPCSWSIYRTNHPLWKHYNCVCGNCQSRVTGQNSEFHGTFLSPESKVSLELWHCHAVIGDSLAANGPSQPYATHSIPVGHYSSLYLNPLSAIGLPCPIHWCLCQTNCSACKASH